MVDDSEKASLAWTLRSDRLKMQVIETMQDEGAIANVAVDLKSDSLKMHVISILQDETKIAYVAHWLKSDELKMQVIEEKLTSDDRKVYVASSLESDELRMRVIETLKNNNDIILIAELLNSDELKMQIIQGLDNDDEKASLAATLGTDELKMQIINELTSEEAKAIIVCNLKSDELKMQVIKDFKEDRNIAIAIQLLKSDKTRMQIIETLNNDEARRIAANNLKSDDLKMQVIESMQDEWEKAGLAGHLFSDKLKLQVMQTFKFQGTKHLLYLFLNGFKSKDQALKLYPEIRNIQFKETIMGNITEDAIMAWGEENENGEWFQPTEKQAWKMTMEGGLKLGEKIIDYSSSDKATSQKTYGSEIAAIKGLVDLVGKAEGITEEEKTILAEQIKSEIYTKRVLSPEIATRIKIAMEQKGIEASIIEVLGIIHDNWVKDNGKKFDDPKRTKKLYQFTDLRLMSYGGDGATADLLFLQPILKGAGIEVDREGTLQAEFERQRKAYMEEHGIRDCNDLRDYLRNLGNNYTTIQGVMTSKGNTIEPVAITDELQNPEILERMVEQVSKKLGLEYSREVSTSEIGNVAKGTRLGTVGDAMKTINDEMSNEPQKQDEKSQAVNGE